MYTIAILLAGGTGQRMGGSIPKQYMELAGKPMIFYSLKTIFDYDGISIVRVVADETWHGSILECIKQMERNEKFDGFSKPGANRQLSICNALKDAKKVTLSIPESEKYVLIHDAARPFLSVSLLNSMMEVIHEADGVLPVLPMKDTIYYSDDGKRITELLDRSRLLAGQAPELFCFEKYYAANIRLKQEEILKINGSTEPAIKAGMNITFVAGDENNFKITTEEDFLRAQEMINQVNR